MRSALAGVRVAARSLSTYKSSTGLVGLAVDRNGRQTLIEVSAQVLSAVKVRPQTLARAHARPHTQTRMLSPRWIS